VASSLVAILLKTASPIRVSIEVMHCVFEVLGSMWLANAFGDNDNGASSMWAANAFRENGEGASGGAFVSAFSGVLVGCGWMSRWTIGGLKKGFE